MFEKIVEMVLALSAENARISQQSRKLLLKTLFRQASQGVLLASREQTVHALAEPIRDVPQEWLQETMRERLLLLEGVA